LPGLSLEERLRRIEELLSQVLERLERLEGLVAGASEEARVAVQLAVAFSRPIQDAVRAARIALKAFSRARESGVDDELSEAIVEALAMAGRPLSLRGLEREVRRIRGTASRAAIRSRLRGLEEAGVVRVERRGRSMVIRLAVEEEPGEGGAGPPAPSAGSSAEGGHRLPAPKDQALAMEEDVSHEIQEGS